MIVKLLVVIYLISPILLGLVARVLSGGAEDE